MKQFTHCLKHEYTYRDLTKPINREHMKMLSVTSLGTQSGGFGVFQPHFKVVSEKGMEALKNELYLLCKEECFDFGNMGSIAPTLMEIIK